MSAALPEMPLKTKLRGFPTEGAPWTWAEKEVLRIIREKLDGDSLTVYAISTYYALCENCSDRIGENPFKTGQPHLARLAGCSIRQLLKALKFLREAGLIGIDTPTVRGQCTYSLRTIDTALRTARNQDAVRTKEEGRKKIDEEQKGKMTSADAEDAVLIYERYPRKVSRQKALQAIRKALRQFSKAELLTKVEHFAKATKGADPQYIPHPATWFSTDAHAAATDPDKASSLARRYLDCDMLLLDDLGKRLPSSASQFLFDVLEARFSEGKTVIVTSNETLDSLAEMIGDPTLAAPLIRRLREFCDQVILV